MPHVVCRSYPAALAAKLLWNFCLAVLTLACTLAPRALAAEPTRDQLERRFAEQLSGAILVGQFTHSGRGGEQELTEDRYTLGEVRKLEGNLWQIQARIQYGEFDVTLPVLVPVEWAGDTPVIIVDNVGFPGLGVYSARVMFHGNRYAGFWQGERHGGHLFGKIERPDAAAEANQVDATTD